MTRDDLIEKLEPVLAKASARPWVHYDEVFRPQLGSQRVTEVQREDGKSIVHWMGFDCGGVHKRYHNHNARLMVEAVNSLPALIAALSTLQEQTESWKRRCAA